MNKIFLIIICNFCVNCTFAQKNVSADSVKAVEKPKIPAYEEIREVPPFSLRLVSDSSIFVKANLAKKKKTLIIMFSPSCNHCIHAVEEMKTNYSKFKNVNIVMATVTKYEYTKKFYDEQSLKDFPNIKIGVDADYFLGRFYEIRTFPSIYLYDKKGFFKKFYNSSYSMLDIAKEL